ncbi:MAG TPA: hypothetical protein PK006_10745 [Saprospiraceae bacterium]|nr:hypothetical protein [Saprospiraceae bacterium]
MQANIFYSWQSDLDKKTHKYFIGDCLKEAIKKSNVVPHVAKYGRYPISYELDMATEGERGSVDIAEAIFRKIDNASLFIPDISSETLIGGKLFPNPNVMIETGYAAAKLGWENVILIFNEGKYSTADLPFDIKCRRVVPYKLIAGKIKESEQNLTSTLSEILNTQKEFLNPLENEPMSKLYAYFWNRILGSKEKWRWYFNKIYEINGRKFEDKINRQEILSLSNGLLLGDDPCPQYLNKLPKTWLEYFIQNIEDTKNNIKEILIFQDKLDFEIIRLLANAEVEMHNAGRVDHYSLSSNLNTLNHQALIIYYFLRKATEKYGSKYEDHAQEYRRQYSEYVKDPEFLD